MLRTACDGGRRLAPEAIFASQRRLADAQCHSLALYVRMFRVLKGHAPVCLVGGCAAGGGSIGIERMGGEQIGIDDVHQPRYVERFGADRFVLGDMTDHQLLAEQVELHRPVAALYSASCKLYSSVNIHHKLRDTTSTDQVQALPEVSTAAQSLRQYGIEVISENTTGASAVMRRLFDQVHVVHGCQFGLRTARPRVLGTTFPLNIDVLNGATARQLRAGMCNGMWRRMPALDSYDQAARSPCCRGNTVPLHGKAPPHLPIGLLNHTVGLEADAMAWGDLTQVLPPAMAAFAFGSAVKAWMGRQLGMPLGSPQSSEGDAALRAWWTAQSPAVTFDELLRQHAAAPRDYVAGSEGMAQAALLDTLSVGAHKQSLLGARSSLHATALASLEHSSGLPCPGHVPPVQSNDRTYVSREAAPRVLSRYALASVLSPSMLWERFAAQRILRALRRRLASLRWKRAVHCMTGALCDVSLSAPTAVTARSHSTPLIRRGHTRALEDSRGTQPRLSGLRERLRHDTSLADRPDEELCNSSPSSPPAVSVLPSTVTGAAGSSDVDGRMRDVREERADESASTLQESLVHELAEARPPSSSPSPPGSPHPSVSRRRYDRASSPHTSAATSLRSQTAPLRRPPPPVPSPTPSRPPTSLAPSLSSSGKGGGRLPA